ncbi:MAG: pyridoxal-dependent decarboxylase, partial [Saprospiraceae bacterium]|nr:pyridoxal-dependent decarboxylase [Saprospiraceae bacterium]
QDEPFLRNAPFISALVQNPNHIGCHTFGQSLTYYKGTQEIERDLLEICAVDILKGESGQHDGYVASGGTEANMQAVWIYRNYFLVKLGADREDICILCSEDSHYSVDKAANVFTLDLFKVPVDEDSREVSEEDIRKTVLKAKAKGKKHFIIICNMMTTIFGSVDNVDYFVMIMNELGCQFKIHIDAAFGGFYYPFAKGKESSLTFRNSNISSFTLDAHKMAQAPYGTGIFLIKKGYMQYANTKQASYIKGEDCTLSGSRSGANAVATWMILVKNGPYGWQEKIFILQKRTDWMCENLEKLGIQFYRHPKSNNITIKSKCIDREVANTFGLMPDNHDNTKWYKIVIMEHVTIEKLIPLIDVFVERTVPSIK